MDATPQTASGSGSASTTAAPSAPATNNNNGGSAATTMRWCVPFAADNAFLQTCTTAVARGNTKGVSFTCVAGGSNEACLDLISRSGADLLLLGGECRALLYCARESSSLCVRVLLRHAFCWSGAVMQQQCGARTEQRLCNSTLQCCMQHSGYPPSLPTCLPLFFLSTCHRHGAGPRQLHGTSS